MSTPTTPRGAQRIAFSTTIAFSSAANVRSIIRIRPARTCGYSRLARSRPRTAARMMWSRSRSPPRFRFIGLKRSSSVAIPCERYAPPIAGRAGYGREILDLLARGLEPQAAIERALADDERGETRQLGVVDAQGRTAAFTGSECNEWAGHATGRGYAAQGNILAGERVVTEMARAFEDTGGALAERLVAALEAAQAAGGDRRGQQSAALVVERPGGIPASREGIDRIVDLRVDDHKEPIRELRRLLGLHARMRLVLDA